MISEMKRLIVILLAANSFLFTSLSAQGIVLAIEAQKSNFVEGEGTYLFITLTNVDNSPLLYAGLYLEFGCLTLEITDQAANRVNYKGPIPETDGSCPGNYELAPQKSVQHVVNLNTFFPNKSAKAHPYHFPIAGSMLKAGTYTVVAKYLTNSSTIQSNSINFEVVEPNAIERNVAEELDNIFSDPTIFRSKIKTAVALENFLALHPRSVYTPQAKLYAGSYYSHSNKSKADSIKIELMGQYPDAGEAIDAFVTLHSKSDSEKTKLVETFSKTAHESRLSHYLDKLKNRKPVNNH